MPDETDDTTIPKTEPDQTQMVLDTLLEVDKEPEKSEAEPEIKVEEPPTTAQTSGDDLSRALATINELQAKVTALESRPTTVTAREERPEAQRTEPAIETVEYFPGVPIAKDSTKRTIRVTDEDLIRAGWNESPAHAIEVMANTFYDIITRTIPSLAEARIREKAKVVEEGQNRRTRFEELFPDLKGYDDLMEIVERNERLGGADKKYGGDTEGYFKAIGKAGRVRVAQLRGMSLEQYESTLTKKDTPSTTTTGTRQRTSPQTSRSGPSPRLSEQQALIEDTLKGA